MLHFQHFLQELKKMKDVIFQDTLHAEKEKKITFFFFSHYIILKVIAYLPHSDGFRR